MTLLSYLCSTILLSLMGVGAYLVLRLFKPSLQAKRATLWLVVAVSWLLPLTPPFTQTNYRHITVLQGQSDLSTGILHSPVRLGAVSAQDYCHCAEPHAGDVILYQTSRLYDLLLRQQTVIGGLLGGIGLLLTLRMFWQLSLLLLRTRRHRAEWLVILDMRVRIIRDIPGLQAASLRLFGKYIFWHHSLDNLPLQDQKAILLHELSHLRQHNSVEKLVLALLQILWWINPAFYFISKELELLGEFEADRFAVEQMGDRKHYACLLLRMKTSEAITPLQFFKSSRLRRRIENVLKHGRQPRLRLAAACLLWLGFMLPGELLAHMIVRDQLKDIEVYEFLKERNAATGQQLFCRKCTYQVYENCYLEPEEVACPTD